MKKKLLLGIFVFFLVTLSLLSGRNSQKEVRAQASIWEGAYGVEFADPSDFPDLASRGVRTIVVTPGNYQAGWESYYSAAVANNIQLVPMLWSGNQTAWSWNVSANEWELNINKYPGSIGAQLLNFLRTNPTYLTHTFAVYGFHEPYQFGVGGGVVDTVTGMRKFWQQIHQEEFPGGQLKIYSESVSYGAGCQNGCADYDYFDLYSFAYCGAGGDYQYRLHVAGVNYGGCSNNEQEAIESAKTKIDWFYNMVRSAPPAPDGTYTKHIPMPQTFAMDYSGFWNRMPEAWEMYDWGVQIINAKKDKIAGMFWYPYRFGPLYHTTLQNSRYDSSGADRWQVINDVAVVLFGGPQPTSTPAPPISPTPTPTPPPKDSDLNGDGQVNGQDMKQLLAAWGPIASTAPEDLDSNGKVNALDAGRIVAEWTGGSPVSPTPTPTSPPGATPTPTSPPVTPPPTTGLEMYGVRFAGSEDYQELAGLGVMHPATVVSSNSGVDSIIIAARNIRATYPNFKPSLVFYSGGWPFTCAGITPAGESFINHMNASNYWDDIMAINGLHEPLGSYACDSLSQAQSVVTQIKQLSGGRAKIFDKLYSDTSYKAMGFADGICDYCAVLYHPYRGNTTGVFQKDGMLANLNRDMNLIESVPPGQTLNKFIAWLCTIDFPGAYGTGLYMPSPSEMLDGGTSIINFTSSQGYQADGFLWYTWANNAGWIGLDQYNVDGQRTGRMEVISALNPWH